MAEWRSTGVCTAEQSARARSLAHSLRGSAGTFGHPEVSLAAERLEEALASVKDFRVPEGVEGLIDRIRVVLTQAPRRDY
jgi:HPt (histidine-containing phosphotransfer) domain-containing protein